jgi:superfamily II DNA or RNA helicase
MTREEIHDLALSNIDNSKCLILELATGMGKSKVAIDIINYINNQYQNSNNTLNVLLIVAKIVHKQNWKDEFAKWNLNENIKVTIECYESLKKYENTEFDIVCLDEVQHLSLQRMEYLHHIKINRCLLGLSATIKRDLKDYLKYAYNAKFISCGIKNAIEDEVLPEPTVYLLPLQLDKVNCNYKVDKFGSKYMSTQQGYYHAMCSTIDWYKNKYFSSRNQRIKNLWLSKAGERLKWLSNQKEYMVLKLLSLFRNYRTLTFCSSIEQSERLGKYNINSKNKASVENLNLFNSGKIKHITSVNILNEGVNLTNCRIGIFCNLNSSEIVVKQRLGRLLRHKNPVIIVPYFKDTREEELLPKLLEEYKKESIKTITIDYLINKGL